MRVVMGSIFRNSVPYLQRYADQATALKKALEARGDSLRLILVDGDSTDGTWNTLRSPSVWAAWGDMDSLHFETHDHHGPDFGSVDDETRFRQSSWVWEFVIAQVREDDDVFLYMESDLIWTVPMALAIIARLNENHDMVSPLIYQSGRMYDTWAFLDTEGRHFEAFYPFHPMLIDPSPDGMYPLGGAGSCIVMKAEVARKCHFFPQDKAIVGLMWDARSKGYSLWLDSKERVTHP